MDYLKQASTDDVCHSALKQLQREDKPHPEGRTFSSQNVTRIGIDNADSKVLLRPAVCKKTPKKTGNDPCVAKKLSSS